MVELIVTIVLIGILSIAIMPRFAEVGIFEARGFQDETKSLALQWLDVSLAPRPPTDAAMAGQEAYMTAAGWRIDRRFGQYGVCRSAGQFSF
jgi:hypothetical protein